MLREVVYNRFTLWKSTPNIGLTIEPNLCGKIICICINFDAV